MAVLLNGGLNGKRKRDRQQDEGGNMFDSSADAAVALNSARASSRAIGALNRGLRESAGAPRAPWDDADGYYIATIGELIGERYLVTERSCGKGVYSNIVKAKSVDFTDDDPMVAIKMVRSNDLMRKAAEKEIEILQKLQNAAGESKRHVVRMLSAFSFRGHQCLVFECMWDDLREVLRTQTNGRGMTLSVVRTFTQQLLLGLRHMHRCGVLHLDVKPDNILINESKSIVKFCDLGTAVEVDDVEISPYLVSRFYRSPEVILGSKPTAAADAFALACTFHELFTGKTLFAGKGNHDQLRQIMELLGTIPSSVVMDGTLWRRHFDANMVFKPDAEADPRHASAAELDPLQIKIKRLKAQMERFPKRQLKDLILERVGSDRCKSALPEDQKYTQLASWFAELVEGMLALDPKKRWNPEGALRHVFVTDRAGG